MQVLFPGATLGVMGSGQLGRMFAQVAIQNGYFVKCYSPDSKSPAVGVGVKDTIGDYEDVNRLEEFLSGLDALTFEFENIPATALNVIEYFSERKSLRVSPSPQSIRIAQNRTLEKNYFQSCGLKTTKFFSVQNYKEFEVIRSDIKFPVIAKSNTFGYDGKGQKKLNNLNEAENYLKEIMPSSIIIEEVVPFEKELSIIISRFENGKILYYPPSENIHKNHILDITINPANIPESVKNQCIEYGAKLVNSLRYVGVLGLEFFLKGDEVLCNEFAPRPHNSGHFSMDSASISQFGLQLKALCNLPTPQEIHTVPVVMKNIMGEDMEELDKRIFRNSEMNSFYLHLYGKKEYRKGRKMGHWNFLGSYEDFLRVF